MKLRQLRLATSFQIHPISEPLMSLKIFDHCRHFYLQSRDACQMKQARKYDFFRFSRMSHNTKLISHCHNKTRWHEIILVRKLSLRPKHVDIKYFRPPYLVSRSIIDLSSHLTKVLSERRLSVTFSTDNLLECMGGRPKPDRSVLGVTEVCSATSERRQEFKSGLPSDKQVSERCYRGMGRGKDEAEKAA
jgi:hypothetical protein